MKAAKLMSLRSVARVASLVCALTLTQPGYGEALSPVIDDFSNPTLNSLGITRQFMNDSVAGGGTTTKQSIVEGVLSFEGEIVPPRGQPGWASTVLLLDPQGLPQDASHFEGIKLLVKVNTGMLSISANSADITNFDFHAAAISVKNDGGFHELKIPFETMKRAWSEQVPLNTSNLVSLSIVAFNMQKGTFDVEVDDLAFY
jgi:hypothetical protein